MFIKKNLVLYLTLIGAGLALTGIPAAAAAASKAGAPAAIEHHQSATTRFIDANGTRLAYRRFGRHGGVPLIFFQHFAGNMDNWDPKIVDWFARDREVILFDNAGVASSGGEVSTTIAGMAQHAIDLQAALGIHQVDLLGLSMGSLIAQQVALERPDLVRRVVLVGSGPRGGVGMATLTPEFQALLAKQRAVPDELLLDVFFTQSATSQEAGHQFLDRVRARQVNRDVEVNDKVVPAQVAAFAEWGAPHADSGAYLQAIRQPVLIVSGSNDVVHYTINSYYLQQHLPNAELIIYPDTNHGPLYQYPDLFLNQVSFFLDHHP